MVENEGLQAEIADYIESNFPLIVLTKEEEYASGADELSKFIINIIKKRDTIDYGNLRQELLDWITAYKDVAERNALAECPDESADYLMTLIVPLIIKAKHDEGNHLREVVEGAGLTSEMIKALIDKAEEEYADVDMTDAEWEEKRWMIIAEAMKQVILKAMGD